MNKYFLLFVLGLSACVEDPKIGKELSFFKLFGRNGADVIHDVIQNDKGYLAVGSTSSYNAGNAPSATTSKTNAFIITVDREGNQLDQIVFEQNQNTELQRIISADKGYIAIGTVSGNSGSDILVLFIDQNGNISAQYTFGQASFNEAGIDLALVNDNIFLLADQQVTDSINRTVLRSEVLVIRIDKAGNKIWSRAYGIESKFTAASAIGVTQNQLVFTNYSVVPSNILTNNLYLTTIDTDGNIVNSTIISSNVLPFISPVSISTQNSSVHVAYSVSNSNSNFQSFISVFNRNTRVINKPIQVNDNFLIMDIYHSGQDNLLISGIKTTNAVTFTGRLDLNNLLSNTKANLIFKYDNFYNLVWSNEIGSDNQVSLAVTENAKNQYLVAGAALFGQTRMAMLIKTTQAGRLTE